MIGFSGVWAEIMRIWNIVAPWFKTNIIDPLAAKFNWLVGIMIENANKMYVGFIQPFVAWFMTYLWPFVKMAIDLIVTNIRSSFDFIVSVFRNVLLIISGVISGIITVIGGIIQFITGVFTGDWSRAWEGIKNIFKGIFEGIGAIVKGVVNTVIDFINMMIRAVAAGMNAVINGLNSIRVTIPDWVPFIGGNVWGLNLPNVPVPQIPRLATGAVIPPNSQFAAILGDQRSGTNIEAPADLIRQIVREELGGSQGGDMNITMPVYLDSEKIYEGQKRVSRRRGSSLVVGSTA
jgi:phage-related protein